MSETLYTPSTAVERELEAEALDNTTRNVIGAIVVLLLDGVFVFVLFGYFVPWFMGPPALI